MFIKEVRESFGITQKKLAMDLEIQSNNISRYETGEREPDLNTLHKIADYFGVSVDYLVRGEDKESSASDDAGVLLDTLVDKLKTEDTIMFNGYTLSREAAEKLANSLAALDEMAAEMVREKRQQEG